MKANSPLDAFVPEPFRQLYCKAFDPPRIAKDPSAMAMIIWHKIANVAHEVERGTGGFLGKPYEPNAVIKNDVEFILMERKAGGYRRPGRRAHAQPAVRGELQDHVPTGLDRHCRRVDAGPSRALSRSPRRSTHTDVQFRWRHGADPFTGTASTQVAAAACGRNTVGIEVHPVYFGRALTRLRNETTSLLRTAEVRAGEVDTAHGLPATA